jgi:hypothetical protein
MTKWVTFLLLGLAILAYGLSQMRPVPPEVAETPMPSPTAPVETPAVEVSPDESSGPAQAPKFGPPPNGKNQGDTKPVAGTQKVDPFSKDKPKKQSPQPMVQGIIKAVSLSSAPRGNSQTKFPLKTDEIYVTVTPEGLNDEVPVVASVRSVLKESTEFSAPVESSGPPRRRTFRLTPPGDGWTSGPYQVVFRVKGTDQVLGLDRFEILGAKEKLPSDLPEPEYIDLVPDLQAEEPQTTFSSQDGEILLRVSAQKLEPNTEIRTVWSAVEVDRLTTGELISVYALPAPGVGKDAVFTFESPPGGFLSGSYKVEVYFDQELAGSQTFFIQPPDVSSESAE